MTDNQCTILQLLSKALFGREAVMQGQDWLGVLEEAKCQAVVRLVDSALDRGQLTEEEAAAWKRAESTDVANSIRVLHNHGLLHEWMGDIPYVVLKGAASASYYPVPERRSMGDVDFLVRPEDLERAGEALEGHGLKPWDEKHASHVVYRGPRMHYEMHFNLAGTPNGEAGDLVREYTRDIFKEAREEAVADGTATLPSPFHHGLVLLLHTCHHMTGEGIGLRHLCDWAVFEDGLSDAEYRGMYERRLKRLGLWRFAQVLTRASVKYLGAGEREWAVADDGVVDALMEDVLTGGNFGNKDQERSNQAYIISSRGKNGVGGTGFLGQAVVSLNDVVYTRWPLARKWKAVLPLGWAYFGARQACRIVRGERKRVHFAKMIDGARQRRELYRQLHLYESER